jgi:hypothetical protein
LSCQIKIVPLLFFPAFALFWHSQKRSPAFLVTGALTTGLFWVEPLLNFPTLFAKNVLGYGSYWGLWGITYLLRLTGLHQFSRVSFFDLLPAQIFIVTFLKIVIVSAALWLGWRNRLARGRQFVELVAFTWIAFFVFAPGVCPQYLVWLAPFILFLSPTFYAGLLVSSSIFLFAFYNITSGGLPWSVALSTDEAARHWVGWSIVPWLVLIAGSLALWRRFCGLKLDLPPLGSASYSPKILGELTSPAGSP